uniref:Uncharacterized protein n=1 Tax=Avena sativa TaxID=4498 RepID=A0ACD5UJ20_AVESA
MDAFADLPGDVLVAILVRLPARSIAGCSQVCRTWRSAISHPTFDVAHAERPAAVVKVTAVDEVYDFVLEDVYRAFRPTPMTRTSVVIDLFRGRWHHDNLHINPKQPLTRALILRASSVLLGSWDGVVCMKPRTTMTGWPSCPPRLHKQYVLWNPLTMAYAAVSLPPGDPDDGEVIGGYSHPSTRRFHLVHASGKTTLGALMALKTLRILRVGDDDAIWREIPLGLQEEDNPTTARLSNISIDTHHARCVRLHGNLHWLVQWGSSESTTTLQLLTFDTTQEKFCLMEAPPRTRSQDADNLTNTRLGVLSGGKLCAFVVQSSTSSMDVWVLDGYQAMPPPRISSCWRLKERIGLVLPDRSDWSLKFCVDTEVEVVEGVREGEEIFLRHGDRIDTYNLRCKEWRMVNVSRSAHTVMHRENILQPEVSFGAASRALSRSPTVDKNGHIRYGL